MHLVVQHPRVIAISAAGYGILWRLLTHFWLTEARPLPESVNELYSIARAHKPSWAAHRDDIQAILRDVLPEIAAWRVKRIAAKAHLRRIMTQGGKTSGEKRREARDRAQGLPALAPEVSTPAPVLPVRRHSKREESYRAAEVQQRSSGTGFSQY